MSLQDPPYKIVLERSATFQHYYLIHVYPPAPLTVTFFKIRYVLVINKSARQFLNLPRAYLISRMFAHSKSKACSAYSAHNVGQVGHIVLNGNGVHRLAAQVEDNHQDQRQGDSPLLHAG